MLPLSLPPTDLLSDQRINIGFIMSHMSSREREHRKLALQCTMAKGVGGRGRIALIKINADNEEEAERERDREGIRNEGRRGNVNQGKGGEGLMNN